MPDHKNGAKSPTDAKIDAAIEAAEAPAPISLEQMTVTIATTGRPVVIAFPVDLTDQELLEFIGWMGQGLRMKLLANRAKPASRLVVPGLRPV